MEKVEKLIRALIQDNPGIEIRFISDLVICKTLYVPYIRVCHTSILSALTEVSRQLLIRTNCPVDVKTALNKINLKKG